MAVRNPAEDVCAELDGQTFQGKLFSAVNGTLFAHAPVIEPDYKTPRIHVWEGSGFNPEMCLNGSGSASDIWNPTILCRVVSDNGDRQTGRLITRDVRDYLHKRAIVGYISIVSQSSAPFSEGQNRASQYEFSLTFQAQYRE